MGLAFIDFYLTVLPSIARHTVTLVSANISPAGGAIATRVVFTVVHLAFTIAAGVVSRAFTVVGTPCVYTVTTMVA